MESAWLSFKPVGTWELFMLPGSLFLFFFSGRPHWCANVSVGACVMGWWCENSVGIAWWMSCSCSSLEIGDSWKLLRKGSWPVCWGPQGIPGLVPFPEKVKLLQSRKSWRTVPWVASELCLNWHFVLGTRLCQNRLYQVSFPLCAWKDMKSMFGPINTHSSCAIGKNFYPRVISCLWMRPVQGGGLHPLLCSCLALWPGLISMSFLSPLSSALKDNVHLILKAKTKQNPKSTNLPKQKKKWLLKRGNCFLLGVKTNKKAPNISKGLEVAMNRWPHSARLANNLPKPAIQAKQWAWLVPQTALPHITRRDVSVSAQGCRHSLGTCSG